MEKWQVEEGVAVAVQTCKASTATADDIKRLEEKLSTHENQVLLFVSGRDLKAHVITTRWGWEDDLYSYNWNAFETINDHIGMIAKIQGQERDDWQPWLFRRLSATDDGTAQEEP